jgi:hypothetical protein
MATTMGDCNSDGDSNGNGNGNEDNDGNGDGDGDGNGNGHGKGNHHKERLPLHGAEMCSAFGGATPCLHPHGHKGKCIHQRCVMGVTLLRVFAPLQGRGFLTAHNGLFFVYFLQLLFSLLNNPLFASRIIQALKNPVSQLTLYLLHSSKNPVSLLPICPGSYCTFCQGKPRQGLQ